MLSKGNRSRNRTAADAFLFSLTLLFAESSCRFSVPVALVTCQSVKLGARGAIPLLVDGHLWLGSLTGNDMRLAPADGASSVSFTHRLSGGNEEWRFAGSVAKAGSSVFVLVVQPDCYHDCAAKILEVLPIASEVHEAWGGLLPYFPYDLELFWSTDEPVLVGPDEWLVLRDGVLKPLCRQGGGTGLWSGPSGVGVTRVTGVTIVAPSGLASSWTPPSGSIVISAAYAGSGQVAVVIRSRRWDTESVVLLGEDGTQIGEPEPIGSGHGWSVTSYGEFAVLVRNERFRRLRNGRLGPESSLGRPETLIPIRGWSHDVMVFRGTDEVCVVR